MSSINSEIWPSRFPSEAVFEEKHGVWEHMPELTITYLTVNSAFSYPPPLQRESSRVGKISPIG